jgi:Secretion system C-terminal sorting domain
MSISPLDSSRTIVILLAIYKNSERINLKITPIVARQKWLLQCVDWNENILLSGKIQNYQYNNEGMLIKADSSGNEIWRKYYGSPGFDCYIGEPYIIDDTTIVLPGRKSYWPNTGPINNTWTKTWILTVDSLGNIKSQWESPKNVENGVATRMLKMPNGNWLYSTSEFVPMPGQIDDFGLHPKIVCRDNNFNFLWERYLGNNPVSFNYTIDLQSTSDGNYVVTGRSAFDAFVGGCFVYKFAPNGDGIWRYLNFCEPVEDCEQLMGGIVELPSGSLVAAGYIENFAEGKAYGLLIKLDKNGCLDTSCSGTTGTYEAEVVSKIKVYPNPSSDLINISNPIGSHIELWDMTGHLIRSVPVQGELTTLRLHDLPAGAYIVRMQDKKLRVSYQVIKP